MYFPAGVLTQIEWPRVTGLHEQALKELLDQLNESQWWPAEKLREHQYRQLGHVVRHAYSTVPYFREQFDELQFDTNWAITPESWQHMPLLTRHDIQRQGDRLHSKAPPPSHGRIHQKYTGGSTGRPVMVLGNAITQGFWYALTLRENLWHRRDVSQRLAVIRYATGDQANPPDGLVSPRWSSVIHLLGGTGQGLLLNIKSTTDQQAAWLLTSDPGYFLTYPSILFALAEHFERTGDSLNNLLQARSFGELLEPKVRQACLRTWGVPLIDMYSTQEVGYVALQCPNHEHYHIQAEDVMVEVLRDDGQPCQAGEIGKVVITTLHNFAMPLLRYDVGDYAEVGDPCDCGRGLPVLKQIVGRQRNMFIMPDGRTRWPAMEIDPREAFDGELPVSQFQFIQRSRTEIEVKLVAHRRLTSEEQQGIADQVESWVGHPFGVQFTYVDEIPRGASGKYEDFRCDIE